MSIRTCMKAFFANFALKLLISLMNRAQYDAKTLVKLSLLKAGAQLAWVPWVPRNPQIFEKYEMEPTDFEGL